VAGRVNPDGTLVNSTTPGEFTLTKEAGSGSYLLTINGKTPTDGMLLLVAGNGDAESADNSMSYEAAGNSFRILGVDMITTGEKEAGTFTSLQDTGFQFAYIDFDDAPSLPGGNFAEADFDNSGAVDGADLAAWKLGFGTASGASKAQGDADADGDVDGGDYLLWQRQLGTVTAVGAAGAVPEPNAMALVLLSGAGMFARARRRG
jgi:hypothetical protein